jgi:DNA-binding NarL/FixJ family response regulator
VDDHDVVRRGLEFLLNAQPDLEVCGEAEDVASALTEIDRRKPDLVLLDISLKECDGLEGLQKIRERHPDLRILVLSMYDESIYAERALRAGANGYVRKLDVAQTIMGAIRAVLAGEVYVNQTVASGLLHRISGGKGSSFTSPMDRLTDRELQVLRHIGRGLSNREIADELFISAKTVESHREHIKQKLGLASSGDLLRYAIEFTRLP